jgi:hypothetical protein
VQLVRLIADSNLAVGGERRPLCLTCSILVDLLHAATIRRYKLEIQTGALEVDWSPANACER